MEITWKGSPNFNKRTTPVRKIVIHWFGAGTLESANARFQNPASKVSAHYGISKGRIWQWVKETDVAYHAGNAIVNAESIGIEHDATTGHNLSDEDYKLSGRLVAEIAQRHNIPLNREHVIAHNEIKPTKCPGTVDLDRIISIAKTMTLKVQLVFNNQHYVNETQLLAEATSRMMQLSAGKVILDFLPSLYTEFKNIPARVFIDTSGQQDMAVEKDWVIEKVWSLNKAADVVVFVGKPGDWQNSHDNIITFGHYYSELPPTFPALIQIVAGETDISWKWPELNAFVQYLIHEVSHPLQQMSGQDRTHEFDYAAPDGLAQILPNLDYDKINYQLTHKVSYERNAAVFIKKENDNTIYLNEADVLVPFSASYESFLADFPNAKVLTVSPNEFLKLRIANKVVIKDR